MLNIENGKEKYIYGRDILLQYSACISLLFLRLKMQPQINYNAETCNRVNKHNNYKRHDNVGYSSICYIESKIG